jgi:hypothetical protein
MLVYSFNSSGKIGIKYYLCALVSAWLSKAEGKVRQIGLIMLTNILYHENE